MDKRMRHGNNSGIILWCRKDVDSFGPSVSQPMKWRLLSPAQRLLHRLNVTILSWCSMKKISFFFPGFEKCFILKRRQMVHKVEKNKM